tara:strand:+ start:266 stop:856 length:591 start_codon:yes stop_codon:yes gene_type:complete
MKIVKFVLPVIAAGFVASSASAATSAWSVNGSNIVPNTVANSLNVDGEGDDWTGAVLRVDLTSGSFYQNGSGGNAAPSSAFIGFVPELEFDTYVGIIDDSSAGIAGGAGDLGGGALSLDAPQFSATWFNTATDNTGAALVANLTLTPDAAGTWELITSFAGGQLRSSGVVEGGALVPEPATLALMGLGGIAALRRR